MPHDLACSMSGAVSRVDALIRRYPNFPKPGILFYDGEWRASQCRCDGATLCVNVCASVCGKHEAGDDVLILCSYGVLC